MISKQRAASSVTTYSHNPCVSIILQETINKKHNEAQSFAYSLVAIAAVATGETTIGGAAGRELIEEGHKQLRAPQNAASDIYALRCLKHVNSKDNEIIGIEDPIYVEYHEKDKECRMRWESFSGNDEVTLGKNNAKYSHGKTAVTCRKKMKLPITFFADIIPTFECRLTSYATWYDKNGEKEEVVYARVKWSGLDDNKLKVILEKKEEQFDGDDTDKCDRDPQVSIAYYEDTGECAFSYTAKSGGTTEITVDRITRDGDVVTCREKIDPPSSWPCCEFFEQMRPSLCNWYKESGGTEDVDTTE